MIFFQCLNDNKIMLFYVPWRLKMSHNTLKLRKNNNSNYTREARGANKRPNKIHQFSAHTRIHKDAFNWVRIYKPCISNAPIIIALCPHEFLTGEYNIARDHRLDLILTLLYPEYRDSTPHYLPYFSLLRSLIHHRPIASFLFLIIIGFFFYFQLNFIYHYYANLYFISTMNHMNHI